NGSNALVYQASEQRGRYEELTPLSVERRGRLGPYRFFERTALLLQPRDVVVDRDQHIAIGRKFRSVAHRIAVTGNDDRLVGRSGEISFGCLYHSVDAAACRVVDEGIEAVPEGVTGVKNVGLGEGNRDVAVRMRGTVICDACHDGQRQRTQSRTRPEVFKP